MRLLVTFCVLLCASRCYAKECKGKKSGLDDKYIDGIVKKHNELRKIMLDGQLIGFPKAKAMPDLAWDKNLAVEAQAWADQCIIDPRNEEKTTGRNRNYTKNTNEESNWDSVLQYWFDENQYFYVETIDSYKTSSRSRDFTQLIWANTTNVGCGYIRYNSIDPGYFFHLYTCDYSPSGNVDGEPVYIAVKREVKERKNKKKGN